MSKKLNTNAAAARFSRLSEAVAKEQQAVERTEIIPVSSIVMNKDNIFSNNDTEESIAALARNIEENGLLHNIVVAEIQPDKYLLISGERRTKAVKSLGRDKIKATIKKNLSEFDILKMLFFSNSETREYTTEEKINIIESFQKKLDQYEDVYDKDSVKKFREYVSQAFNINERQANKLISITNELTEPLKQLLYKDNMDINTAAALAQLPSEYQEYAADIINKALQKDNETAENKKCAADQAMTFSKQAKKIISKTNNVLAKERASRTYHIGCLEKAKEELMSIEDKLLSSETTSEQAAELTEKKNEKQQLISKYNTVLKQLNKKIDDEIRKQHDEIGALYASCDFIKNEEKRESTDIDVVEKEIQTVNKAIDKLLNIKPSEELESIKKLFEQWSENRDVEN